MTTDELFATWIATKRHMLLSIAREARAAVNRTRALGNPVVDIHHAKEEYAKRLERAAEALGPPTVDPRAPQENWGPSDVEGCVLCLSCKVDVKDAKIGKLQHVRSNAHKNAMALQGA